VSSLRVAFDVTPVISGSTGIARYTTQLADALERESTDVRRFAVGRAAFPVPSGARHLQVPARVLERWWRVVEWPRAEQLVKGADLVHATGPLTPATRRPLVVTVHDVAALRYPDLHPARHVNQQRAQLKALGRAAAIAAVSASTADELANLGIAADRIVVTPLGLTPLPEPVASPDRPEPGYVLAVGETSPRKRYPTLLRALAQLDGQLRLVMAGPPGGDEQRIQKLVAELGLTSRVQRFGAVSDASLSGLYEGALALCFPSIAEGFGLPVLEAMACGVPVVVSDIPVMHEVAGDAAAMYVPVDDTGAWAAALAEIAALTDRRDALAVAARDQAAAFTWDRTAKATVRAYELAAAAGS
jgi:glycosyltransferase involved in cell wall biosynthesis